MGTYYQKKTDHSKRKMRHFEDKAANVTMAEGKASFQMVLPMSEMLLEAAGAIEQTASEVGLRMMKALIDKGVELLTVNKLQLPSPLKTPLGSTNLIESSYSAVGDLCRNVKRWRGERMAMRWAGTMLLAAEKRFRRLKGHREMPVLAASMGFGIMRSIVQYRVPAIAGRHAQRAEAEE